MITSWDMYWITRLDSINAFLVITAIIGLIAGCIVAVCYGMWIAEKSENEHWKYYRRILITDGIISLGLLLISCFIPSTKEFAVIYLIPKIAANEQVQKIPDNALKLLNGKMEEWINDFRNKEEQKEKIK